MKINVPSAFAGVMTYVMYPGLARAAADPYQLNLPEPQTVIAQQIYDQHMMVLWICLAIFIGVFGVMFYSIVKHRKSKDYEAANFHHSTTVEIIWICRNP
jgi:cytochrome c oxidase subunit II